MFFYTSFQSSLWMSQGHLLKFCSECSAADQLSASLDFLALLCPDSLDPPSPEFGSGPSLPASDPTLQSTSSDTDSNSSLLDHSNCLTPETDVMRDPSDLTQGSSSLPDSGGSRTLTRYLTILAAIKGCHWVWHGGRGTVCPSLETKLEDFMLSSTVYVYILLFI